MPAPNVPTDIIDRIRELERQVRELSGRVSFRSPVGTLVDPNGYIILSGDPAGGIATPWLEVGLPQPLAKTTWATTTNASFEVILRSFVGLIQPYIFAEIIQGFQSGTGSGQIRLMINGVAAAEVDPDTNINGVYPVPGWDYSGSPVPAAIEVQAKRISGTGVYAASARSIHGRPS